MNIWLQQVNEFHMDNLLVADDKIDADHHVRPVGIA
jgi:hypothetical protein